MLNMSVWENQIQLNSCYFANKVNNRRYHNDSTYTNAYWLRDALKKDYQKVWNLTDEQTANMTFKKAYEYADAIFSERFEGIKQVIDWNET